jgi:hypothetical protein
MVNAREYPEGFLRFYLKLPIAWRLFGKQFFIVADKVAAQSRGIIAASRKRRPRATRD